MNVLYLCNEYPPARHGGIGALVRVLARGMAHAGHEVRVIGIVPPGTDAPEYEEDRGVRVWRYRRRLATPGWIAARYSLARTAMRWARRGEVDVIDAPDYQGWTACWPRLEVPVVVRLHGSATYFAAEAGARPRALPLWIERAALERADFICSSSVYTAGRTRRLFGLGAEMAVIYNPVDLPPHGSAGPRPSQDVVFSGTLAEKKGIRPLVRAWRSVAAAYPGAKLHIYGKDGRTESGESMAAALRRELNGTAGSVEFHGHVPHEALFAALASARAAVFPSFAEAFAVAPLEAMAHGCATVYTRRGSGPELIRDGIDGLLIDPGEPDEIAAALCRLLTDAGLAARLGEAGRLRARQEFATPVIIRKNERYYAECLERFHKR